MYRVLCSEFSSDICLYFIFTVTLQETTIIEIDNFHKSRAMDGHCGIVMDLH